jgi:hypothetical protein
VSAVGETDKYIGGQWNALFSGTNQTPWQRRDTTDTTWTTITSADPVLGGGWSSGGNCPSGEWNFLYSH